jgi:hypothetical protein
MNNNSDLPGPMIAVFGVLILVVGLLTAGMVKSADEGTYRSPVRPHLRPSAFISGARGAEARPVLRSKNARPSPSPPAPSITSPATPPGAKLTALALALAVCADTTTITGPESRCRSALHLRTALDQGRGATRGFVSTTMAACIR